MTSGGQSIAPTSETPSPSCVHFTISQPLSAPFFGLHPQKRATPSTGPARPFGSMDSTAGHGLHDFPHPPRKERVAPRNREPASRPAAPGDPGLCHPHCFQKGSTQSPGTSDRVAACGVGAPPALAPMAGGGAHAAASACRSWSPPPPLSVALVFAVLSSLFSPSNSNSLNIRNQCPVSGRPLFPSVPACKLVPCLSPPFWPGPAAPHLLQPGVTGTGSSSSRTAGARCRLPSLLWIVCVTKCLAPGYSAQRLGLVGILPSGTQWCPVDREPLFQKLSLTVSKEREVSTAPQRQLNSRPEVRPSPGQAQPRGPTQPQAADRARSWKVASRYS